MRSFAIALLLMAAASPLVTAEPGPWLRISTPNFELYTSAGEKSSRDTILYFEQVREFFIKAAPVHFPSEFPVRIIVFKSREQFAQYTLNSVNIAYYISSLKRDYIVMADPSAESYTIAVHEYMHLIIRRSGLHIPVWLNEGLADVYSTLRPVRDGVAVGDLIPGRMQPLLDGKWLPFESLTSATNQSAVYNEAERVGVFYAESWALAHMLFLSPDYRENFGKFLMALNRGKSSAEACTVAYGKSSEQVFRDLQKYLTARKLYGRVFETKLSKAEAQPEAAPVDEFDSRVMLADLLTSIGKLDRARTEYQALEQQYPGRPEVPQSLGYLSLAAHDTAAARQYFSKAYAAGDSDPQMCLQLAILDREANDLPEKVAAELERALRSRPGYADALIQMGIVQIRMNHFEDAITTLMGIPNVTPEQAMPVFSALAYAYLQTGDLEQARANILSAKKWARSEAAAKSADLVLGLIDARAKGPFAPHRGEKLQRVEASLRSLDCSGPSRRLIVFAGSKALSFLLPDASAVEMSTPAGSSVQLACGALKPVPVALFYAPASPIETGIQGIVRRMEF